MTTSEGGLTEIVTTLTAPLLQPTTNQAARTNTSIITAQFSNLRHSITHFSPIKVSRESPAHGVTETELVNLVIVLSSLSYCVTFSEGSAPSGPLPARFANPR